MARTFRKGADLARALDLPVLAVIPVMHSEMDRLRLRRRRIVWTVLVVVAGLVVAGAAAWALQTWGPGLTGLGHAVRGGRL